MRTRAAEGKLSYTQLRRALRAMGGANYAALCFRHAVMARPCGMASYPPSKALAEAEQESNEQMLCFMRTLDMEEGTAGAVSSRSFADVVARRPGRRTGVRSPSPTPLRPPPQPTTTSP